MDFFIPSQTLTGKEVSTNWSFVNGVLLKNEPIVIYLYLYFGSLSRTVSIIIRFCQRIPSDLVIMSCIIELFVGVHQLFVGVSQIWDIYCYMLLNQTNRLFGCKIIVGHNSLAQTLQFGLTYWQSLTLCLVLNKGKALKPVFDKHDPHKVTPIICTCWETDCA